MRARDAGKTNAQQHTLVLETCEREAAIRVGRSRLALLQIAAYAREASGRHQQAILDYDEAIRGGPQAPEAYHGRGNDYFGLGQYQRAIQDCDEAIRLILITTDALVTVERPVDYGIHQPCQLCQVCVNHCPGWALQKEILEATVKPRQC